MPSTLTEVSQLIELCRENAIAPLTLLVVPGHDWTAAGLEQLRRWSAGGCQLAGHGWLHRCATIRGIRHRLHSRILSRNVAEHLCLSGEQIVRLMHRCFEWFSLHGFAAPQLYVPPAWALGSLSGEQLRRVPFQGIETLGGMHLVSEARWRPLPLLGFEADTWGRAVALRTLNGTMRTLGKTLALPTRISLHPFDHRLRLQRSLRHVLGKDWLPIDYAGLFSAAPGGFGLRPQNK